MNWIEVKLRNRELWLLTSQCEEVVKSGDCAWKVLLERNRLKSERGRRFIKTSPLVSQKFNAHQETYIEFFSFKNMNSDIKAIQREGFSFDENLQGQNQLIQIWNNLHPWTLIGWENWQIGKVQRLKIEIKSNWWYFEFVHCYHHIIYLKNTSMYWYLPFINIEKDFKTDMELLVYCPN